MRLLYHMDDRTLFTKDFRDPNVQPGLFRVERAFETLSGEHYDVGDKLLVLERTEDAPHNRITTKGNWRVKGKNGKVTVWSNIEMMVNSHVVVADPA